MNDIDHQHLMAWVESKSRRDEDTGCLIWSLAGAHGKEPQGRYLGKVILVRRAIVNSTREKPLGTTQSATCSCETEMCVEETHLVVKFRAKLQKGRKLTQAHRAKISASVRKSRKAKLTEEAVADIRSKQEKREVYAERYGILPTYVNDIQAHITWKEYEANPFFGLGARR